MRNYFDDDEEDDDDFLDEDTIIKDMQMEKEDKARKEFIKN
jgi:hypothetical protein